MVDTPEARQLSAATVEEMLQMADPVWDVEDVVPAERGFCSVYRIVATREDTREDLYLKASPDGERWAIPDEARLQAVLDARTSIPVPEVLAIVDDHERLPTPFYLMGALPGEELPYEQVGRLDDDVLRRLARETGHHLGELHSVPAVDSFGHVRHDGPELAGDRPGGTPANLTVEDPRDEWLPYLRARVDQALDRHADSAFSAFTSELAAWFEAGIQELEGPFDPVLGRNDHGLHNLLVEPETGEITGMIDWGYTLAVPAAFDFEFAVYLFSGAFLAGLPDVSDRRSLVRESMLDGYRTAAPDIADRVEIPEPRYEALAMVRIMNDFHHLDLPEGTESDVRERIEADLRELLDGSSG
jgi:aminoglycoside phosphotransferase (APT) family kinase protein